MKKRDFQQQSNKKPMTLGMALIIACFIIKPLIFYSLMDIRINLFFLWAATAAILILMFGSFKNKIIPFGLYVLISFLMFGDLIYNGYFNGYLSIDAAGSLKYIGEVWEIIISVIRLEYWLIFWDLPLLAFVILKDKTGQFAWRWIVRSNLVCFIIFLFLGNFSCSRTLNSVGNLEFFSAHIKDLAKEYITIAEPYFSEINTESFTLDNDKENRLFGVGKGRNLIVIQMEALQNFVINAEYNGNEITPVMNRLIKDEGTLYFDNYYMQIAAGNTSDAEFATNNSIYGTEKSYTYELYKRNTFRGLPVLLREIGYTTIAMHGYDGDFWSRKEMYPSQGFDTFIDSQGYNPSVIHGWGILDEEFYTQSIEYLKRFEQPFYSFMVSLSNHTPFEMEEEYCRLNLLKEHVNTRFGNYLNSTAYSDHALLALIKGLKEAGLYENSIIAIYGDHFGLAERDENNGELLTDFLGKPYRFDEMAKIPLIIHIPGENINETIGVAGGQLDFLPTITYLMGIGEPNTIYLGQNLITAKSGFVAQNRYAPRGSFIGDEIIFLMSGDKVFENGRAWMLKTGEEVPLEGLKSLSERAASLIGLSEMYLADDYISKEYGCNEGDKIGED